MDRTTVRRKLTAFLGGLLQVLLVVISQTIISRHSQTWLVMLVAFGINWNWTHNARRVSLGDEWDRIIYGLGGATGAGIGYVSGGLIADLFS